MSSQFFVFDMRSLPAGLISENFCNDRIRDFVLEFLSRYIICSASHPWLPSSSLYVPNGSDTAMRFKQEMCVENLHALSLTVSKNNTQCYSGHTNLSTMKFINSSLALILEDINIEKMARECVEALRLDQAKEAELRKEDKENVQMGHNGKTSILIFTTDKALLRQARNIFVDTGDKSDSIRELSIGGVHNDFKYDDLPKEPHDIRLFEMMANGSSSIDLGYPMGRRLWETSTWEDQLLLFKHLVNLISVAVNPSSSVNTGCEVKIVSANTSMSSSDNVLGSLDNAQHAEIQKLQAFLYSLSTSSLTTTASLVSRSSPSPPVSVSLVQVPPLLHFYEQQLRALMNMSCPQISAEVELVSGSGTRCSLSFSLRSVNLTGADLLHTFTKNITLETVAIVPSEGLYGSCLQGPSFDLMPKCNGLESTSTESVEQNLITFNAMCCSLVSRQVLLIVKLQECSLQRDDNTDYTQSWYSFWAIYAACGEGVTGASMMRLADKDNFLTDKGFSYDSSMYMNRKATSSASSSKVSMDESATNETVEAVMTSDKQAAGAMELMRQYMSREGTPLSFEAKSTINFMNSYFESSIAFISEFNPLLFASDRIAASIALQRRVQSSSSGGSSSHNMDRLLYDNMLDNTSKESFSIDRATDSGAARAREGRESKANVVRGVSFQLQTEISSQDSLDLCDHEPAFEVRTSKTSVPSLPSLLHTGTSSTNNVNDRGKKGTAYSASTETLTSIQSQSLVTTTRKKGNASTGSSSKTAPPPTTKTTAAIKNATHGSKRRTRSGEPTGPWPSFLCDTSDDDDDEDSMESYRQRNTQSRASRETAHQSLSSELPARRMKTRLRRKSDSKRVHEEPKAKLYTPPDDMDFSDEIEASL